MDTDIFHQKVTENTDNFLSLFLVSAEKTDTKKDQPFGQAGRIKFIVFHFHQHIIKLSQQGSYRALALA
jgi:hypothetical protein